MRKFWICAALVCVILLQIFSVSAAPAAKSVSAYATVSPDGSCQMTLTANVYLDGGTDDLQFPLPAKASNITVNGARAHSRMEGGLRQVDVSRVVGKAAGDFTLTFTYQLPNLIVTNDADQLELHLPETTAYLRGALSGLRCRVLCTSCPDRSKKQIPERQILPNC